MVDGFSSNPIALKLLNWALSVIKTLEVLISFAICVGFWKKVNLSGQKQEGQQRISHTFGDEQILQVWGLAYKFQSLRENCNS